MKIDLQDEFIEITKHGRTIRISQKHIVYVRDVVTCFDHYYSAVEPEKGLVDFSHPKLQRVIGFDLFPVLVPSFIEPFNGFERYTKRLKPGMIVFDLGAYEGLSSIAFVQAVGESGKVIAVEADKINLECARENLREFHNIELLEGAVWSDCDGVEFSVDGNMGAGVVSSVGKRGFMQTIPSYTLMGIVEEFALERVDFIKMDIEGAEWQALKDVAFFERFHPEMSIELHRLDASEFVKVVEKLGYAVEVTSQEPIRFPVLECHPV